MGLEISWPSVKIWSGFNITGLLLALRRCLFLKSMPILTSSFLEIKQPSKNSGLEMSQTQGTLTTQTCDVKLSSEFYIHLFKYNQSDFFHYVLERESEAIAAGLVCFFLSPQSKPKFLRAVEFRNFRDVPRKDLYEKVSGSKARSYWLGKCQRV